MKQILDFINHRRSTISVVLAASLIALGKGLAAHHVDWYLVASPACTALAGILPTLLAPPADVPKN